MVAIDQSSGKLKFDANPRLLSVMCHFTLDSQRLTLRLSLQEPWLSAFNQRLHAVRLGIGEAIVAAKEDVSC